MLEEIRSRLYTKNEYGVEHQKVDVVLTQEERNFLASEFEYNQDWHNMCINCQARQLIKYKDILDKDGKPFRKFSVDCKGVAKSLPPGSKEKIEKLVTQENMDRDRAILIAKASQDPVAWAELMFGYSDREIEGRKTKRLRPYQKEQLRCTSKRIVIREGRRAGKTHIVAIKLLHILFHEAKISGYDYEGKEIIKGPEIMIVTPYLSQLLNIFDEMESLLKLNKLLKDQVVTGGDSSLYVKTPFFRIETSNGGVIKGFVSGTGIKGDGSGGGTMRGQNATIIYLDEMDLIPDEVLEKVVMPILLTDEDGETTLIATSTPIGKRGKFYKWCLEDPYFKQDHFPSSVLPQWDRIKRDLEPPNYTQEAFDAEFMALFTDGNFGVFKPSLVRVAKKDYSYKLTINPDYLKNTFGVHSLDKMSKVMGIDWNKNAGSEFVVVGYDFPTNQYIVLEAVNIPSGKFSAAVWKETVVRLNHKWQLDYVYADQGYGQHIIEDLKLMAYQFKDSAQTPEQVSAARLYERLIAFDFGSKIELKSPIDNTPILKTGKEYLVQNAVRIFEDEAITFSEEDRALYQQLLHYIVVRISDATHKPVYGTDNKDIGDHRLDAFMLALAGLQLEFGQYSKNVTMAMSEVDVFDKEYLETRGIGSRADSTLLALGVVDQTTFLKEIDKYKTKEEASIKRRNRGADKEESFMTQILKKAIDWTGYETDEEAVLNKKSRPRGRRSKLF